ncbi:MAG: hypothetical protein UHD09_01715 [Bifidobacterium sp.]|nr:hypothetical protein [Bifidobacterium sp.]
MDGALKSGISIHELKECARKLQCLDAYFEWLLTRADGKSENGGESFVRGMIIAMGFRAPEIQVVFSVDGITYRVDFLWRLPDGRIIVLELDGRDKYVDPTMTHGKSAAQIAVKQSDRDEFLRSQGVDTIIHTLFEEACPQVPLFMKLVRAGVPWDGIPAPLMHQAHRCEGSWAA